MGYSLDETLVVKGALYSFFPYFFHPYLVGKLDNSHSLRVDPHQGVLLTSNPQPFGVIQSMNAIFVLNTFAQ